MPKKTPPLTPALIQRYIVHLREQERSAATIQKYTHDLNVLCADLGGQPLTKAALIEWKQQLIAEYAPASVNSMLAAVNSFLSFMGWRELTVKPLRIQKALFADESKELTRAEYNRLVRAAEQKENERLSLVIQTICGTGIRVSELVCITAEAVHAGKAVVRCKNKTRVIFIPAPVQKLLLAYMKKTGISAGPVFVTRSGRPLDRSNIWKEMKALCQKAGVDAKKVFPHNLRHLFARTFYSIEKDVVRLADLLGHSSINTTRIYTMDSGMSHLRSMERVVLQLTT